MKLSRFLNYFRRVQPAKPNDTKIVFMLRHDQHGLYFLNLTSAEFDIEANAWTINLVQGLKVAPK